MKAYSHLSAEERIRVDELRNREGLGVRQIALRISREPRRGPWLASNENEPSGPKDMPCPLPKGTSTP